MQTIEAQFPPIAQALGRLRPTLRSWPFATKPTPPNTATTVQPQRDTETARHDFLRIVPEPVLTGELPPPRPATPTPTALPETNRTYWFDL